MQEKSHQPETIESWDPLDTSSTDPRMIVAAQRRVIRNILKSYTGYYDVFCELLQNALDAVERRYAEKGSNYKPQIWIRVDIQQSQISVTDNGCGMTVAQFKTFLAPNLSFKDGKRFRGSKGVGATYLAYGFNHLEVATKLNDKLYSGILRGGRNWVEDSTETMVRPMVENVGVMHTIFQSLDRGTSFTIRLNGSNIRPKDLSWFGATTAEQWLAVLRLVSPLGGIYMCNEAVPNIQINVETISKDGTSTQTNMNGPCYLYPHEVIGRTVDLREFLAWQRQRIHTGKDPSQLSPKYLKLNGLWGNGLVRRL